MYILNDTDMEKIQNTLNQFVAHNDVDRMSRNTWILDNIMYAPTKLGGFNMIKVKNFFHALKNRWIRRYVSGLDDHWTDLLDEHLGCDINSQLKLLKYGAEHPKIKKNYVTRATKFI